MSVCIGAYIRGIGYTGPWHSCKWRSPHGWAVFDVERDEPIQSSGASTTPVGSLAFIVAGRRWSMDAAPGETAEAATRRLLGDMATTPGEEMVR